MADTYTSDVIKYIRQKSSNGFDQSPVYLGAEQRYVGALRNSGINNLEEQYILGTDTYTEKYYDDNKNLIIERSYHINDAIHASTDYYKLILTLYRIEGVQNPDYFYDKDQVNFPNDETEVMIGDGSGQYLEKDAIYGIDENTFSADNDVWLIHPTSAYVVVRREELHYISNNGADDLLVTTKVTEKKYGENGKTIIRESVTNHLRVK